MKNETCQFFRIGPTKKKKKERSFSVLILLFSLYCFIIIIFFCAIYIRYMQDHIRFDHHCYELLAVDVYSRTIYAFSCRLSSHAIYYFLIWLVDHCITYTQQINNKTIISYLLFPVIH